MSRCKSFICLPASEDCFLFFSQSNMVECTHQCNIKVVKTISTRNSIIITLNNKDGICQYSVFIRDQHKDSNKCQPSQENPSHVECKIENLDPGTWYHLNITSWMDEKQQMQQTLSLPTSKESMINLKKKYFTFYLKDIIKTNSKMAFSCLKEKFIKK